VDARIRIFNTMTGQKEDLVMAEPGRVRMYVCGPTVYSFVHIGNARTFTAFDVAVRHMRARGLSVTYVRNFTDVDDKIIRAAQETGETALALSQRYVEEFRKDAAALKLIEPDVSPKVSDHIAEILALIQKLVDRGVAYASQGDVYFQVSQYAAYAKLSKRSLDDLRAGERVQPGEQKREPLDFALWKAAKPGEPSWPSPWGPGRPGWHIECSAMAARYLGENFELHGGGLDLIFPHHENELAQSEAASGRPFCRCWMHCGFLDLEGAKMSKSLGNVVRLRDALDQVDAEALRLFFLSTHYRNPLSFSEKSLQDAEGRVAYFYETLKRTDERLQGKEVPAGTVHGEPTAFLREFQNQLDDDFNCAGALSSVSALFGAMNEMLDKPPTKDKAVAARTLKALRDQVATVARTLGVLEEDPATWLMRRRDRLVAARGIDRAKVERLIDERKVARAAKDFARADAIRQELTGLGVEIQDGPSGTAWKVV